jgi:hypothetical protein
MSSPTPENASTQLHETVSTGEIWIKRDDAATADLFELSKLSPEIKNIAHFRNHIKKHYSEVYSNTPADNIVIKDKDSGEILDPATLISELAGNSSKNPYPVEIAGMPLNILSLVRKVFSERNHTNNHKALTIGAHSSSSSSVSSSSALLLSKESGSQKPGGMVSSLVPSQKPLLKTSTNSTPFVKKVGGKTVGQRLRNRVAVVDQENDFE